MIKRQMSKTDRKNFKQIKNHKDKRVTKVKPYPIPDLDGKLAKEFEIKIRKPPTDIQQKVLCEASIVYSQTKLRK